ncbi:hypothetical protein ACIGXI_34440 [Kitasatospora aureofaciens]|uniref:hypothetical protein n=1 Tax=Kitasatospora aureofaciens TaxID=1894 RepID=UPI0037CCA33B
MPRYSIDPTRHELIVTWGTGEGDLATRVAALPTGADTTALLRLARALTRLSEAAWHTYTHPASAAGSLEPNSEGWRREQERQAFSDVTEAISQPNLPQGGSVIVSYSPLIESAHPPGRPSPARPQGPGPHQGRPQRGHRRTRRRGERRTRRPHQPRTTGRATQPRGRLPVQVTAADHLLEQDPFGPAALFTEIDPTAASVAAAHWLAAAAEVAADASGQNPTAVLL